MLGAQAFEGGGGDGREGQQLPIQVQVPWLLQGWVTCSKPATNLFLELCLLLSGPALAIPLAFCLFNLHDIGHPTIFEEVLI